ncbi:MAG: M81 family metallopeptidase [Bacteroidota bacterium]
MSNIVSFCAYASWCILLSISFFGCNSPSLSSETYKVAVVNYMHETCTFCPGGDTEIEDWTKLIAPRKGEELLKSGSFIRGFTNQSRRFDDIELIGLTSPISVFGGSSRSWNSRQSFEHFMGIIVEELTANLPVDGVYLSLHGAMAVRDIPRPEAEIAKRIREIVGKDVPIVGTFDLHGNEDEEFLKWANGSFVTKRYPHYDAYLQGERAARFLRRNMMGEYVSTTASRTPPILTPTVVQWTGQSPSMDIMERARRWESREHDAFVNVFYGFPWSDVPDVGISVHVMTNNDQELADKIADDMEAYIWRVREAFVHRDYPMPKEAVQRTKQAVMAGKTPVVLGDYSDRPGDATWILEQLIAQGVNNVLFGTLRDERVLQALQQQDAKAGDLFDMEVGGFTGPQAGRPVHIQGTVRFFGEMWSYAQVAAIEFGDNNMLVITPAYEQIRTPGRLRFGPIDPDTYEVFVTKSRVHFRRGFDETGYAKTILVVDAPGPWIGTSRLDALPYEHAPIKEMYPYKK